MKPYPRVDDLLRPFLGVAMPRAGPLYAPGETKTCPRASPNSSSWSLKGARYLFT